MKLHIPEGWKLVPIIPTRKMVDRGYATRPIEECWRVMLEASPLPSTDRAAPPSVAPVAWRVDGIRNGESLVWFYYEPEWVEKHRAHGDKVTPLYAAPPSVALEALRNTNAAETWAYIERLLHDECGLRLDEGLGGQRANC